MKQTEETTATPQASFASHGKAFQEKVLQAMIKDKNWATQFIEVFDVEQCLEPAYLKVIADSYIEYYKKYKEYPSDELLRSVLKDRLDVQQKDIALWMQVVNFLERVNKNENLGDLPWVKEKSFTFCKQQRLKRALSKSVDIIQTDQYETVVEIIKEALAAGMASSPGHDYNNDIDARYSETFRNCVPTGIKELDDRKILNGGLGAGEIGIVVAPTGVGKTHLLIHIAAQAILRGKNVFYYSMELNERYVGIRVDSHVTDIPSLECPERKEEVKAFFADHPNLGKLTIKEYPARTPTINTFRAHIEKMALQGKIPDVIVVDYAGIIRSTEKYDLPRMELQCVIQELRSFGKELNIPVWTALQSNKEGAKSEIVDVTNMSEGYGQAMEADFVVGLQRLSTQKSTGYGNIFIAKNRAGIDGVQFKIHLDTSRSKLRILTEDEIEDMFSEMESERKVASEKTKSDLMKDLKEMKAKFDADSVGKRINDTDSEYPRSITEKLS